MTMESIAELFDLSGKTALVTGGSKGLGKATALRLAQAGADVMVTGRDAASLDETVGEIKAIGGRAQSILADARSLSDAEKVVQQTVAAFGRLDILVNNAGIYPSRPMMSIDEEVWDAVHDTNLKGVFFHSQAAARVMMDAGRGGRIINLASMGSFTPMGANIAYDSSKGGVVMLTKSMAYELAHHRILVNAIAPGFIMTPGVMSSNPTPEVLEMSTFKQENILLGGWGEPDDIARVMLFLASGMANYITGTVIVVDGGYLLA